MEKIIFHRYVVSEKEIKMDKENVKAIQEWHIPKSIIEVKSFHDLANSYKRFVKDCSTLVAYFTEIVKKMSRI